MYGVFDLIIDNLFVNNGVINLYKPVIKTQIQ